MLRRQTLIAASALLTTLLLGCASENKPMADAALPPPPPPSAESEILAPVPQTRAMPAQMAMKSKAMLYAAPPKPAYIGGMVVLQAEPDREVYAHEDPNPIHQASADPVSTFSADVDTGAYANIRRFLRDGQLPPSDAVRVEEMINYFDYAYAIPQTRDQPFSVTTEVGPNPWNPKTRLLHIGIQGWKPEDKRLPSNLVFLVDVSGSMGSPDKLPLVKTALKMLSTDLNAEDRISLVTYAGSSGIALPPTAGDHKADIDAAIDQLGAGGSTNGASGIELAYKLARQAYVKGGVNRVLLATDGDFNVGTTSFERLLDLIRNQRKSGIELTTLGFGDGNYNERLMEQLADQGNGNHAYIDSAAEAQKVLVRQRQATLQTIARDVKIQIEFNPAVVSEYRLIGYENRALQREDFNNDQVDAGEIGAGHTVTALYEISLAGSGGDRVDPLRYGSESPAVGKSGELAFLRLRYKRSADGIDASSRLIEQPILTRDMESELARTSQPYRLSAAVAAFGQLLAGSPYTGQFGYDQARELANTARGADAYGEAGELVQLIQLAGSLQTPRAAGG